MKRSILLSQLRFSFAKELKDCTSIDCGCGEIGRRTRFRFWRRKAWGFKSLHPHQYFKQSICHQNVSDLYLFLYTFCRRSKLGVKLKPLTKNLQKI